MYKGSDQSDPTKSELLTLLKQAIINTGTKRARKPTETFSIEQLLTPLRLIDPEKCPIKDLRSKTLALLAITGLFRPSDLARISLKDLSFQDDHVDINHFGGKTDKEMNGIQMKIFKASDTQVCPVLHLQQYIKRTADGRKTEQVFISIKNDEPIGDQRISNILKETLKLADIDAMARSFRKTGATAAINDGVHPDLVMKLGRWRSPDVFFKHYVDWKDVNVTDRILNN